MNKLPISWHQSIANVLRKVKLTKDGVCRTATILAHKRPQTPSRASARYPSCALVAGLTVRYFKTVRDCKMLLSWTTASIDIARVWKRAGASFDKSEAETLCCHPDQLKAKYTYNTNQRHKQNRAVLWSAEWQSKSDQTATKQKVANCPNSRHLRWTSHKMFPSNAFYKFSRFFFIEFIIICEMANKQKKNKN